MLVFQFLNIFTYFNTKGRRKTNHRKKKILVAFLPIISLPSIIYFLQPLVIITKDPEKKCVTSYYLSSSPLKINLQTRRINSNLAHYKICKELDWMHVSSSITMTINGTQELCPWSPKLNHVSSWLNYINLSIRKKNVAFSFPLFNGCLFHFTLCQLLGKSDSSEERISQCFPKKLQEQNCRYCRQKVTSNKHSVSKRRSATHTLLHKNDIKTLTEIPGFLLNFIPNTGAFYKIGNIKRLIQKLVFSVPLYYKLCE